MTCSSAPKLAYGSVQISTSTFVNYTCNSGYSMQGSPSIECSNGVWNMTDYPICLLSLEQYSNSSMSYHADSNTTTDTSAEFSTWFVYGIMGSGGCLALAVVAFCLLACFHICGCCPGPVVAVGGRYQYPDRRWYSVFNWCDFMVKGKVCKKIRKMNKSKAIGPASVVLDIEGETSKTGAKMDELEKEKDAQPPGDADLESQANDAEKEKDVSSSTSGYASSSPSTSPLPEEESLLPENANLLNEGSLENDETKHSPSDSDNAVVASAVNTKDVSSPSLPEKEPLLPAKKRVSTKAQRTKPKTKQPRPTSDDAELPNNEKTNSKATSTNKPATKKTVKPKTKQLKK